MRRELDEIRERALANKPEQWREWGVHAGLAYDRWAPAKDKSVDQERGGDENIGRWLERLEKGCPTPKGYREALLREEQLLRRGQTIAFEATARSRLLIGHGNPGPTEVGLTLHHTWGVPLLPGSALKGLTASYAQATYGPSPDQDSEERRHWRGPTVKDPRVAGASFRRVFGAPGADGQVDAWQGDVLFHDALWLPGDEQTLPLARDVLTVHQMAYYGGDGWPNDYDSPNPVAFLSVRPKARFRIVLGVAPGTQDGAALLAIARTLVAGALTEWGIGGKTSAGYGRFECAQASLWAPGAGAR